MGENALEFASKEAVPIVNRHRLAIAGERARPFVGNIDIIYQENEELDLSDYQHI